MKIPYVTDNETARVADIPSAVLAVHAGAHLQEGGEPILWNGGPHGEYGR
jgi:hypothetical protein